MVDKLKIIALPGDLSACGYYRVFAPLAALERAGLAEVYRPEPTKSEKSGKSQVFIKPGDLVGYDVAVFQRQPEERITALFEIAKRLGVRVVFDVDDDVFSVPADSPAYLAYGRDWRKIGGKGVVDTSSVRRFVGGDDDGYKGLKPEDAVLVDAARQWTERARANLRGLLRNLRLADLVTVSTERLRQVYSAHRNDILVLHNQVEQGDWENAIADPHQKPDGEMWLGWAGSKTHWPDLKEISGAIVAVLRRNQSARLVLMGFPEALPLFKKVAKQVVTFDWMPITDYRRVVAAFDVALAPSAAIAFNEGKSDIRILEAALCGIPVVASETPYGDTVREAGCGFVAKSTQKWVKSLNRLVKNASLRSEMGEAGRKYVTEKRTYDANAWRWAEAYQQIM